MSRHVIPATAPGLTVAVGWDNPLQTFFAQVSRNDAGPAEDPVLLWLGGFPGEIKDPEALVIPLSAYATLTSSMVAQLRADHAACGGRPPSPLQAALLSRLDGGP